MNFLSFFILCLPFETYSQINDAVQDIFNVSQTHATEASNSTMVDYHNAQNLYNNSSAASSDWTEWSSWSKCRKCVQKRMKLCLNATCDFTKLYQERHCKKKRCERKRNQLRDFHVLIPEKVRFLTDRTTGNNS
ncbi:hypothetical protein WA026_006488 [Henosepilachna vigintioctopunctata]|uniref:Uncharacterized protein n=1 Tax=Henosepilachna vigintioctopunctata TaxID=420089 RepID=A0AAW1UEG0_9CUCU